MSTQMANNGFSHGRVSIFGERRNRIKSMWDIIFEDRPKEWISFKPALDAYVYPCYACHHLFSSLPSLQDHINRRIIVLKYHCVDCKGITLTFYNRCALLLHTRLHYSLKEGQVNLSEVDTFTLPVDLAGFLPVPNIPLLYEKDEEEIDDNIYINVQFYSPGEDQKGKAIIVLQPNDFLHTNESQTLCLKQVCRNIPKCKFITLYDQKRLKERGLLEEENETDPNSNVKIELFDYVDKFTLPIISKVESLHEKAFNIPRCLECNSDEATTMAEHYQGNNKPTDSKLTCETCKFVASTECSFKAHRRIHKNEPPHVCPECGKDFDNSQSLHNHLNEVCFHLAKNVKYRCPGKRCSRLFVSLANFAMHFKQHLKFSYMCSVCKSKLLYVSDLEKHIGYHNGNCTFSRVFDCGVCTNVCAIIESEYPKHIEMHSKSENIIVYVYLCRHCHNFFRSKYTFASHFLKCTKKMLMDSKKRLGSKSKVIITKKFFCLLCNEQITLEKKVSHMKLCKYANPVIHVKKLDNLSKDHSYSVTVSTLSPKNNKRPKSRESLKSEENGKKKRKRYLTDISRRRKPERIQPDLIAEKPVEFDGLYYCKLCNYKSAERTEFHIHVRIHRNISTAYQCMECGECFVVKPSLCKHLLHFHNISDCESYLMNNNCFDVEAVKELENVMRLAPGESKGPVKENQCRVCLDEFEDSVTLDKHFRTHGMAFLLKNSK